MACFADGLHGWHWDNLPGSLDLHFCICELDGGLAGQMCSEIVHVRMDWLRQKCQALPSLSLEQACTTYCSAQTVACRLGGRLAGSMFGGGVLGEEPDGGDGVNKAVR